MRLIAISLLATLGAAGSLSAQLQTGSLDKLAPKATESTDINLDSSTLQMAGSMFSHGSAGLPDSLSGLKAVSVKSFKFAQEGQYQLSDLDPIRAQLQAPQWKKIVGTQEKGELSEIYSKSDGTRVTGFAVLTAEPKELTVVYIDGTANLADLSKLSSQFNGLSGGKKDGKDKDKSKPKAN